MTEYIVMREDDVLGILESFAEAGKITPKTRKKE